MKFRNLKFSESINEAMILSMKKDKNIICYGLGIDDPKRVFGTTKNLKEKFGSKRVFDMEKYYLSTKIDGHICFILKKKNKISLVNHNSTPFERKDLIKELSETLKKDEGIYVGEIYFHSENKRTRSYDLKKEVSETQSDIRIAVFDLLEHNNTDFSENDWNNKKNLLKSNESKTI